MNFNRSWESTGELGQGRLWGGNNINTVLMYDI